MYQTYQIKNYLVSAKLFWYINLRMYYVCEGTQSVKSDEKYEHCSKINRAVISAGFSALLFHKNVNKKTS